MRIKLIPAKLRDALFIYELMSNPKTRRYFENPDSFTLETHLMYLQGTAASHMIIMIGQQGIGLIRELQGEITIALLPEYCGQGIGKAALRKYCRNKHNKTAEINYQNMASIRIYESVGFAHHCMKNIRVGIWKLN